jgi:amino acid transporter
LSIVFREVAGMSPAAISAIAIVATLNTVLVQMTMASRVIYGMASQGDLPAMLGRVQARTATPLLATALVASSVLVLAVSLPIERLAEWTSVATLIVFALVNLALIQIQRKSGPSGGFTAPRWVPVTGLLTCLLMLATALF